MFDNVTFGGSVDRLEQHLVESMTLISQVTAGMLPVIRALDVAQVMSLDGARGMDEWLASRLDVGVKTARTMLALARACDDRIDSALEGGASVDRAVATLSLIQNGADEATVEASAGFDIAGVRQLAGRHRRLTPEQESDGFADRYLHIQPSLDDSRWRLWGQLSGTDGRIVEKAIHTAVDALPDNPDTTASQDRADGLVSVASEWLAGEIGGHDLAAEIFIDADLAARTNGEAGVSVVGGTRLGPATLGEILCEGTTRVIVFDETTRSISTTPSTRTIPPAIRSYVFERDGHRCVIAGCQSRSRLQPHHLIGYAQGGTHHPDNLITVCWYHHHIVIHQQGLEIDPQSPPQRRTFLRNQSVRAGPRE
jgi:hypothetical protein